jgi:hypothetical protein
VLIDYYIYREIIELSFILEDNTSEFGPGKAGALISVKGFGS